VPSRSEFVREAYRSDAVATIYDEERSRHARQRVRAALERSVLRRAFACVPREAAILDVACGTGRLASFLAGFGSSLTGLDASLAMLEAGRARDPGSSRRVAGDAGRLPFASRSFDVVVSTRFVRHLDAEGRVAVFRELARVTRRHVLVDVLLGTGLVWAFKRTVKGRAWAEETGKRRPAHREVVAELEASGLRVVSRHALLPWVSQPHVYVCERK